MSRLENQVKMPISGGLARARKKLKEIHRKDPSPELVKIIDEVTSDKSKSDRDIAAHPRSSEAEA